MKTSRPITTVSYNTEPFLRSVCDSLLKARVIEFYTYIFHYREVDEGKNHFHLLLIPSRPVQTLDISDEFEEPDPTNDKPLCVDRVWHKTSRDNIPDWLLYVLHDVEYLKSKLLERAYHYQQNEFVSSDDNTLQNLLFKAYHESTFVYNKNLNNRFNKMPPREAADDLISSGYISLDKMCGLHHLVQLKEGR